MSFNNTGYNRFIINTKCHKNWDNFVKGNKRRKCTRISISATEYYELTARCINVRFRRN